MLSRCGSGTVRRVPGRAAGRRLAWIRSLLERAQGTYPHPLFFLFFLFSFFQTHPHPHPVPSAASGQTQELATRPPAGGRPSWESRPRSSTLRSSRQGSMLGHKGVAVGSVAAGCVHDVLRQLVDWPLAVIFRVAAMVCHARIIPPCLKPCLKPCPKPCVPPCLKPRCW